MRTKSEIRLIAAPSLAFLVGAGLGVAEACLYLARYPALRPAAFYQLLVSASAVGLLLALGSLVPLAMAGLLARRQKGRENAWILGNALSLLSGGGLALMVMASFRTTVLYRHLPGGKPVQLLTLTLVASLGLALAAAMAPRVTRAIRAQGLLWKLGRSGNRLAAVPLVLILAAITLPGFLGRLPHNGLAPSPENPNVVLISIDTLRADHLGCYGYDRNTSPRIDQLAKGGVRFEHATTTWPSSAPGHASMLTGLYPPTHGVLGNGYKLSSAVPTIAEAAQKAGLRTAGFVNNPWLTYTLGFAQGFENYFDADRLEVASEAWPELMLQNVSLYRLLAGLRAGERQPAARLASQFVQRHRDQRFFLFLHLLDPHQPYFPDPDFKDRFLVPAGGEDPGDTRNFMGTGTSGGQHGTGKNTGEERPMTPELEAGVIARYDECISNADARVGEVLTTLEELELMDRTLVLLTSDHGENMTEANPRFYHEGLGEGTLRVPFILAGPGVERARANASQPISLVDAYPTLAALSGLELPEISAGRVLVNPDSGLATREILVMERPAKRDLRMGLRTGEWKLVTHPDQSGRNELVSLAPDLEPDVDQSSTHPSLVDSLSQRLGEVYESTLVGAYPSEDGTAALDSERIDQLKALGYLN